MQRTTWVWCVSIPSSSGHQFTEFRHHAPRGHGHGVSIPSSSGHQFTVEWKSDWVRIHGLKFQSLLHQGISLLGLSIQPEIRRLFRFQSLLHQGISLLCIVLKPYRFQERHKFQSLLHQGISLLSLRVPVRHWKTAGFQSLLHQGISLLPCKLVPQGKHDFAGFNPFFIRASVY